MLHIDEETGFSEAPAPQRDDLIITIHLHVINIMSFSSVLIRIISTFIIYIQSMAIMVEIVLIIIVVIIYIYI